MSVERFLLRALLAVTLTVSAALPVLGEQEWYESYQKDLVAGKPLWKSDPVLHPGSGSYFQLVRDQSGKSGSNGRHWDEAVAAARNMTYKGRRGRLAVIDNPELHQWILNQWDITTLRGGGQTWIGLRYWCPYRQLAWIDGTEHPFTAYTPWSTPWYRQDGIRCSTTNIPYMGVYIDPRTLRWRATGYKKAHKFYIVEYPARQESTATDAKP